QRQGAPHDRRLQCPYLLSLLTRRRPQYPLLPYTTLFRSVLTCARSSRIAARRSASADPQVRTVIPLAPLPLAVVVCCPTARIVAHSRCNGVRRACLVGVCYDPPASLDWLREAREGAWHSRLSGRSRSASRCPT